VYAAFRPANVRLADGPPVIVRGSGATLAFELVNRSGAPFDPTAGMPRAGTFVLGVAQTWIRPLTAGVTLDGCAAQLGRRGAWVAAGGRIAMSMAHAAGQPIGADDGLTITTTLPEPLLGCMPAGRYRYRVDYLRVDDVTGSPIATATLDLSVMEPARWSGTTQTATATVSATLDRGTGGRSLSGSVTVRGLTSGQWAWIAVRSGECNPTAAALLPPATLLADGSGTDRLRLAGSLSPGAVRALAQATRLSLWVTVDEATSCTPMANQPPATAASGAPSTWAGGHLRAAVPGTRLRVTASSEILAGSLVRAADGRTDNAWNSGGYAPAWVELDLGRNTLVTGIKLMPSQLPQSATTLHRVYGRVAGARTEVLLAQVSGTTVDGTWTTVTFAKPRSVRYVRVLTVRSPSWVAWREITVLGPDLPKPSLMPIGMHDIRAGSALGDDQCAAAGWTVDPDDEARHVTVRVLVDGEEVWRGIASLGRPDVLAAGFGSGTNGFHVPLAGRLSKGVQHQVWVQARDDETGRWSDLGATPKTLTCY
jgi:hypothetical protein